MQVVQKTEAIILTVQVHTGFWWEDIKARNHSEDLGLDGRVILK